MTTPPGKSESDEPLSAASLRASIAEKQAQKASEASARMKSREAELKEMFREFLEDRLSQNDLDEIKAKILRATENGQLEVEVMKFPSATCTDRGRAINNSERNWPEALQGKAKDFYDFFVERGRAQGFGLKALIVSFPDGMPGDVGLSVTWND